MKKRWRRMMAAAILALSMTACSGQSATNGQNQSGSTAAQENAAETNENKDTFKIGCMVTPIGASEENYRYAEQLQEKYGEDRVIIDTFPEKATVEQEITISKVMAMGADPDLKAIVFSQADNGTIAAVTKLKEKRPDIFVVAANPNEDIDQIALVADMLIIKDQQAFGKQIGERAVASGAKNFVHYSFPRHMANQLTAQRAQIIREECEANGINFIEATAPDPMGDAGTAGAQQFILEDVPIKVKELGEDTMFFATNDSMWEPLAKACIEQHAIYVGPSDPSPYMAYPAALGINIPEDKQGDTQWLLEELSAKTRELNMAGRLSTWSCSSNYLGVNVGAEYAMAVCRGEIPYEGTIDLEKAGEFAKELIGAELGVSYMKNAEGKEYKNYVAICGEMYVFE